MPQQKYTYEEAAKIMGSSDPSVTKEMKADAFRNGPDEIRQDYKNQMTALDAGVSFSEMAGYAQSGACAKAIGMDRDNFSLVPRNMLGRRAVYTAAAKAGYGFGDFPDKMQRDMDFCRTMVMPDGTKKSLRPEQIEVLSNNGRLDAAMVRHLRPDIIREFLPDSMKYDDTRDLILSRDPSVTREMKAAAFKACLDDPDGVAKYDVVLQREGLRAGVPFSDIVEKDDAAADNPATVCVAIRADASAISLASDRAKGTEDVQMEWAKQGGRVDDMTPYGVEKNRGVLKVILAGHPEDFEKLSDETKHDFSFLKEIGIENVREYLPDDLRYDEYLDRITDENTSDEEKAAIYRTEGPAGDAARMDWDFQKAGLVAGVPITEMNDDVQRDPEKLDFAARHGARISQLKPEVIEDKEIRRDVNRVIKDIVVAGGHPEDFADLPEDRQHDIGLIRFIGPEHIREYLPNDLKYDDVRDFILDRDLSFTQEQRADAFRGCLRDPDGVAKYDSVLQKAGMKAGVSFKEILAVDRSAANNPSVASIAVRMDAGNINLVSERAKASEWVQVEWAKQGGRVDDMAPYGVEKHYDALKVVFSGRGKDHPGHPEDFMKLPNEARHNKDLIATVGVNTIREYLPYDLRYDADRDVILSPNVRPDVKADAYRGLSDIGKMDTDCQREGAKAGVSLNEMPENARQERSVLEARFRFDPQAFKNELTEEEQNSRKCQIAAGRAGLGYDDLPPSARSVTINGRYDLNGAVNIARAICKGSGPDHPARPEEFAKAPDEVKYDLTLIWQIGALEVRDYLPDDVKNSPAYRLIVKDELEHKHNAGYTDKDIENADFAVLRMTNGKIFCLDMLKGFGPGKAVLAGTFAFLNGWKDLDGKMTEAWEGFEKALFDKLAPKWVKDAAEFCNEMESAYSAKEEAVKEKLLGGTKAYFEKLGNTVSAFCTARGLAGIMPTKEEKKTINDVLTGAGDVFFEGNGEKAYQALLETKPVSHSRVAAGVIIGAAVAAGLTINVSAADVSKADAPKTDKTPKAEAHVDADALQKADGISFDEKGMPVVNTKEDRAEGVISMADIQQRGDGSAVKGVYFEAADQRADMADEYYVGPEYIFDLEGQEEDPDPADIDAQEEDLGVEDEEQETGNGVSAEDGAQAAEKNAAADEQEEDKDRMEIHGIPDETGTDDTDADRTDQPETDPARQEGVERPDEEDLTPRQDLEAAGRAVEAPTDEEAGQKDIEDTADKNEQQLEKEPEEDLKESQEDTGMERGQDASDTPQEEDPSVDTDDEAGMEAKAGPQDEGSDQEPDVQQPEEMGETEETVLGKEDRQEDALDAFAAASAAAAPVSRPDSPENGQQDGADVPEHASDADDTEAGVRDADAVERQEAPPDTGLEAGATGAPDVPDIPDAAQEMEAGNTDRSASDNGTAADADAASAGVDAAAAEQETGAAKDQVPKEMGSAISAYLGEDDLHDFQDIMMTPVSSAGGETTIGELYAGMDTGAGMEAFGHALAEAVSSLEADGEAGDESVMDKISDLVTSILDTGGYPVIETCGNDLIGTDAADTFNNILDEVEMSFPDTSAMVELAASVDGQSEALQSIQDAIMNETGVMLEQNLPTNTDVSTWPVDTTVNDGSSADNVAAEQPVQDIAQDVPQADLTADQKAPEVAQDDGQAAVDEMTRQMQDAAADTGAQSGETAADAFNQFDPAAGNDQMMTDAGTDAANAAAEAAKPHDSGADDTSAQDTEVPYDTSGNADQGYVSNDTTNDNTDYDLDSDAVDVG